MKTKKLTAVILAFSIILGGQGALAAQSEKPVQIASSDFNYSKEAKDALAHVNKIRREAGLDEVKLNPYLTKAAENHAKYLDLNDETGHDEVKGKKGFTGEEPKDRILAVDGSTVAQGSGEVISYSETTVEGSIDLMVGTAYHRNPFLNPYTSEIGIGLVGKNFVMLYSARASTTKISMYPYDGQKNVPTTFTGAENPNPLKKFGVDRSGYVISFYPPHVLDTKNIDATIKDSKGNSVPFFSEWYSGYWFFYTKEPLKNGEKYTVSVNYKPLYEEEYEGKTLNKTWSFTTAGSSSNSGSDNKVSNSNDGYSKEAKEALDYINKIRKDAGLGEVKLNPFLTKAAENHANYLNAGNPYDHDEIEGKKGFTGVTPKDRVLAVGGDDTLARRAGEVMLIDGSSVKDSIDRMLDAAYHRRPFLIPSADQIGVAFVNKRFVMLDVGFKENGDSSLYPYDGQKDVPTTFFGANEDPNPLRQFGLTKSGYVISMYVPYTLDTKKIDATIKDSKGNNVPYYAEWYYGFGFFYTKEPFKSNEKYTVSVNYKPLYNPEFEGKTLNKTWSFTTATSSSTGGSNGDVNPPPSGSTSAITGNFNKENVGVTINGDLVSLSPPAKIVDGSTFIPLRGVFEKLNSEVKWNNEKQEVTIVRGSTTVKLTIGSKTAYVNGKAITLSTAPFINNSSTYVPLRFASESIGAEVSWDQTNFIAIIKSE